MEAQQTPKWEPSTYVYNRFNVGKDFENIERVQLNEDGSILIMQYPFRLYRIRNQSFSEITTARKRTSSLLSFMVLDKKVILFFEDNILAVGENKEEILIESQGISISQDIFLLEGKIYFSVVERGLNSFYSYDGNQLKTLIQTKEREDHFLLVENQIFHIHYDVQKKETLLSEIINGKLKLIKTYPFRGKIVYSLSKEEIYYYEGPVMYSYDHGRMSAHPFVVLTNYHSGLFIEKSNHLFYSFLHPKTLNHPEFHATSSENYFSTQYNKETNSTYLATGSYLYRVFPYFRKYPHLFNQTNSYQIFGLNQTGDGKEWACAYNGGIAIIDDGKITSKMIPNFRTISASLSVGNKIYLNTDNGRGMLAFEGVDKFHVISDTITSFYNFLSDDSVFYAATNGHGVMFKKYDDIENQNVPWQFVGKKKGWIPSIA